MADNDRPREHPNTGAARHNWTLARAADDTELLAVLHAMDTRGAALCQIIAVPISGTDRDGYSTLDISYIIISIG